MGRARARTPLSSVRLTLVPIFLFSTVVVRADEIFTTTVFEGRTERVREMLEHGAAVNARGQFGTTPLHWASNEGHLAIVALLIDQGKSETRVFAATHLLETRRAV